VKLDAQVGRAQALDLLPVAYAVALRLRDSGASRALIADALGIETVAVPALLEVADRKLGELLKS
jgi:hypothetical protein